MTARNGDRSQRRGAPWTDAEDDRLLRIADLPPRQVAEHMQRSWHACRRRLAYLRANGAPLAGNAPARGGPASIAHAAGGGASTRQDRP